eukprot:m.35092 g.35092  ORF g.35092 m.35092 type:complete len:394 (-) comp17083_c1_seq2:95-1276(-)
MSSDLSKTVISKMTKERVKERMQNRELELKARADPKRGMENLSNHVTTGYAASKGPGRRMQSALGFEYTQEQAGRHAQFMKSYMPQLTRRSMRWAESFPNLNGLSGKYSPDPEAEMCNSAKLKRFVRKGIPNDLRPHVWMSVSGAGANLLAKPGYYNKLVHSGNRDYADQISLDIPRTFPNNIHFKTEKDNQQQLHRVLLAYANHNPKVGYCQGMNFVAGMLLLVLEGNEEQTFWLFDAMVAKLPPKLYDETMIGIQIETATLAEIIKTNFEDVAKILKARSCLEVLPVISVKWFINAFVDTVPEETVLRIWDVLFYEDWKVIYRVGVAMLVKAQKSGELETHDQNSILEFLTNIGWSTFDCTELFTIAFDDLDSYRCITRKEIERVRATINV